MLKMVGFIAKPYTKQTDTQQKAKKRGEASQQKAHETLHLHESYHAGTISGFSPCFKKRYYGGKSCMENGYQFFSY